MEEGTSGRRARSPALRRPSLQHLTRLPLFVPPLPYCPASHCAAARAPLLLACTLLLQCYRTACHALHCRLRRSSHCDPRFAPPPPPEGYLQRLPAHALSSDWLAGLGGGGSLCSPPPPFPVCARLAPVRSPPAPSIPGLASAFVHSLSRVCNRLQLRARGTS